jgi:hypothetical protein
LYCFQTASLFTSQEAVAGPKDSTAPLGEPERAEAPLVVVLLSVVLQPETEVAAVRAAQAGQVVKVQ